MDYTEITVDTKFHRHLIGKGGVNSEWRCCQTLVNRPLGRPDF